MKNYFFYILIPAVLCSSAGCGSKQKTSEEQQAQPKTHTIVVTSGQFDALHMQIDTLRLKQFETMVKASGKIDVQPQYRAKVTSYLAGYIKASNKLVGDKVTKGDRLLTIDSPEFLSLQQSYLEAMGQLKYLKSEYKRQQTLYRENISSQKSFLQAESDYKKDLAAYKSLQQRLIMLHVNPKQVEKGNLVPVLTIYAPISGIITTLNANIGMAVSSGDVILDIVDTNHMILDLAVFEKDAFKLHKGQKIRFGTPQGDSNTFQATISQIGRSIEGKDRVVQIYASFNDQTKKKLITGMFVEANLIASTRMAKSVPYDAVITEEGKHFLLVYTGNKNGQYLFRKTLVHTGERNGDQIEIFESSELPKGTQVLTKGAFDVN